MQKILGAYKISAMGRKKLLDRDIVIDTALRIYWAKGFEHVSMAELARQTGYDRAGVYKEFGSEDDLICEVLIRYRETVLLPLYAILGQINNLEAAMRFVFDSMIQDSYKNLTKYGIDDMPTPKRTPYARSCLFFGLFSSKKGRVLSQRLQRVVKKINREINQYFEVKVDLAQKKGEVDKSLDPKIAARFLMDQFSLAQVLRERGEKKSKVEQTANYAMRSLIGSTA